METRPLGSTGPRVSAVDLGCMGMSDLYGPASESLAAPGLALTESDLKEIERAVPWKNVSGERYSAQGMAMLDSESKR